MKKKSLLQFDEVISDDSFYKESEYTDVPTPRSVFSLVTIFVVLMVGITFGKVSMLNIFNGAWYKARAEANVTQELNVPVHRALILDRFGTTLADNKSSFSIFINLEVLSRMSDHADALLYELANRIDLSYEAIDLLVKNADFEVGNWIIVARDVGESSAIAVRGMEEEAIRVVDDYERVYPQGSIFSHIIGYTGLQDFNEISGRSGIEYVYDERIRGTEGLYIFYEDARGGEVGGRLAIDSQPAEPFMLTIDAKLQEYFYKRLQSGLQSLGRTSGVGIALDPRNGEVLALVSLPSFDNNVFVDPSRTGERGSLLTSSAKPLFNRVVSGNYNPGSTIKPLDAFATLREGIMNEATQVYSDGTLEIPNVYNPELPSIFLDWKAHGWVDIKSALARSSNIYFYLAGGGLPSTVSLPTLVQGAYNAQGIGINTLHEYWEQLGFGKETGIDLPFESYGFLPSPHEKEERTGDIWRLGDTYNVSIGQGDLSVTPLQLISFIASIANNGIMYQPFLAYDTVPKVSVDYSDWAHEIEVVQRGMRDGVTKSYGTSHALSSLPIAVSGKTGSAQTNNNTRTNALFVGYAPRDNPEIAILVLVENAREGSSNTLPIAYDVFEWYYDNRIDASVLEMSE